MEIEHWTRRETTILIDLWKSCPVLYNSSLKNYYNKQVRNRTINYIVKELEKVGTSKTVIEVKHKLRNLQSQLSRERKKLRIAKDDYEPTLWCFNELSFLWSSSFSVDTNEGQDISSDSSDHHHCPATPSVGHRAENSSDSKTKNSLDEVEPMEELEAEDNSLDEEKPMEELDTKETEQKSFSFSANENVSLKSYKQKNEETKIANDSKEINKNNNLIKEYIDSFTEFVEEKTSLYQTIRNDTSVKNIKKKEITHMLEVPKTVSSTTIMTNIQSKKKLEERQEAFCKYLAIELKQIKNDDLFDELKLEILQHINKKIKQQNNILSEDHPINIKDYLSFIS